MTLRRDIEYAINRNSAENGSNTPDFMLAEYLADCLTAFDKAVKAREKWYGRDPGIGPAGMATDGRIITLASDPIGREEYPDNGPTDPWQTSGPNG